MAVLFPIPVLWAPGFFYELWHPLKSLSDRGFKEKLIAGKYNPADIPFSSKDGATCGMSMTEKQGGSDVRANTTEATPVVPGKEASGGVL